MSATQAKENVPLQVKVYSRWVADQLAKGNADVQVNDIFKNLPNGVFLVELSTALTGKDPKREWNNQFNNSLKIKIFTIIMLKSSVVTC